MTNKPKYKTALINPPMAEVKKKVTRKVQVGTHEEQKKLNIFSAKTETVTVPIFEEIEEWVNTGELYETHVDLVKFQTLIATKANELAAEGYRVISIMPIDGGRYKYGQYDQPSGMGPTYRPPATCFSYGFSYTTAAIITAELNDA